MVVKCLRCKRKLKDPESISLGYGPICAAKLNVGSPKGAIPRKNKRKQKSVMDSMQLRLNEEV